MQSHLIRDKFAYLQLPHSPLPIHDSPRKMNLTPAIKKDEALVEEMDSLLSDKQDFYLWWLGQSGFLLQVKGQRVIIDPYLSDSLTTKYANTNKPHVRMSERVIDPSLLTNIFIVSSSHNHTDHLDAE